MNYQTQVPLYYTGAVTYSGVSHYPSVNVPKPEDIELKEGGFYWAVWMYPQGARSNSPQIVKLSKLDVWFYDITGSDEGGIVYGDMHPSAAIKLLKEVTYD